MIEGKALAEFGVELRTPRQGEILQANGQHRRGGRKHIDEIGAVEFIGQVGKHAGVHQQLGMIAQLGGGEHGALL
jgi:hypothetical protein